MFTCNVSLGRFSNQVKYFYKEHYAFFLFILLSGLLIVGLGLLSSASYVSVLIAIILMFGAFFYYYGYFKVFRLLTDTYSQKEYYFEAYSIWGVLTFNALFIFIFAYVGSTLAVFFPSLGFGKIDFSELLLYLVHIVVDGITFGLLSSYSITFSSIQMNGFFANSYAYMVNLIVDLAFIVSVFSVIRESVVSKRELKRVIQFGSFDPNYFSVLTPIKVKEVIRNISIGKLDIKQKGDYLVQMLSQSNSKEARDIILQIMQSSCDDKVFLACIDYFQMNFDHRFLQVCKKIKGKEKRKILRSKSIV